MRRAREYARGHTSRDSAPHEMRLFPRFMMSILLPVTSSLDNEPTDLTRYLPPLRHNTMQLVRWVLKACPLPHTGIASCTSSSVLAGNSHHSMTHTYTQTDERERTWMSSVRSAVEWLGVLRAAAPELD